MAMAAPLQPLQGIVARVLLPDLAIKVITFGVEGACFRVPEEIPPKVVASANQPCYSPSMSTASLLPIVTEDPALARDTEELYDALEDLLRVYQFRDRDRICCFDVSVSQCYALEGLVRRGSMTLNDLAAYLYLDKSTASRVVDALERKGYVARSAHPKDRRALLLEATPAGRELEGRIRESILAEERQLLADFAPEVRQSMTQLIRRLARAASASVETGGGSCCRIP
jgi:MarR family transcriptional regulator, 2-MHQ and catechol-resistance regulon repressor